MDDGRCEWISEACLPDSNHIVIHLLQLLLGGIECVRWRVEFIRLEALVRQSDLEWLVILL
jgi:hypothetical protein